MAREKRFPAPLT